MTSPDPASARAAVERNTQAVAAGNLALVLADITPEAMAQMMQAAAQQGAGSSPLQLGAMPNVESYEIREAGTTEDTESFHVSFVSNLGRATIGSTWKQIAGQWKVVGLEVISIEPAETAG